MLQTCTEKAGFRRTCIWPRSPFRGRALGFNRSRQLNKLKRHHPLEIAPWGRWLPDDVHQAMREWMLMAHRLRFPKPLRMTVAEYICTSSGW